MSHARHVNETLVVLLSAVEQWWKHSIPARPRAFQSRMRKGESMDWRNRAACLTEDPELFFPIGNTGPALVQIEEAKAVCQRCEVVDTCLRWAMESGQDSGVWGGLSEDERRALKRRTARARRAAASSSS